MIKDSLAEYVYDFELVVGAIFDLDPCKQQILYDAATYSLLLGGKRIRPFLLNRFYKLCGGEKDNSQGFELAIECIHTYSLIHDDLPCMDDDDMRRGQPSCHKKFGEANALLAGDALLTEAWGFASCTYGPKPENVLKAIRYLSRYAGMDGMIGGQTIDLMYENKPADIETLREICSLKTGALIIAACEIGCILADADEDKTNAAKSFAENIGLAFQIVDDILDVVGNEEKLGKPIHSDIENNKSTFVSLLGVDKCRELVKELTDKAKSALDIFGEDANELKELADYLCNRDY